ncbi:MAG: helix-turn-helix domain-containing protein [Candidatus Hermodarchaeota archaeon]|nr:helix-turn-helix domain-containing protein [Candidatus Hermodarchaeota archaeon]
MLLAYKIRINPTAAQTRVLWALSEKCRLLYNFALAERLQQWEKRLLGTIRPILNLQSQARREKGSKN